MIEVENLSFTYPGGNRRAIDGVSFGVQKGEVFGLLGPSGSGKSTTQKILIGLLKGYDGGVRVLGDKLENWGSDYYEQVGVSFETPNHYQKLTALENLDFFRSLYSKETENPRALLAMVGLDDAADTRVAQFSKGMQTRLTFVRALLHRPTLVFLDEPTSGLDPMNARRVKETVSNLREKGCTVFLTTHDMAVAEGLCDRVAFVVDGKVSVIDSPRNLKLQRGERRVRVEYVAKDRTAKKEFSLDDLGSNEMFLELLRKQTVETIHTEEATLEDVFVETTGRTLV